MNLCLKSIPSPYFLAHLTYSRSGKFQLVTPPYLYTRVFSCLPYLYFYLTRIGGALLSNVIQSKSGTIFIRFEAFPTGSSIPHYLGAFLKVFDVLHQKKIYYVNLLNWELLYEKAKDHTNTNDIHTIFFRLNNNKPVSV